MEYGEGEMELWLKGMSPEEVGALEPKAEAQVEEDEMAPETWRAPVVWMW